MIKSKKNSISDTQKEIFEQPEVFRAIIAKHISGKKVMFPELEKDLSELKEIERISFLGCGTSYHASMLGNYFFEELTGLPCEFELADEFIKRKTVSENKTAYILLSQSGETTDAILAAKKIKKIKGKKSQIISIINKKNSTLETISDFTIKNLAGEEKALAATKSYTSQLLLLILLAIFFAQTKSIKVKGKAGTLKEIKYLPSNIRKILLKQEKIKKIADELYKTKKLIFLGGKYNYPTTMEGALKIKETTYIQAEGFASGEFRHGPIAIVTPNFPCILISPKDSVYKINVKLLKELKRYKSKNIVIVTEGDNAIKKDVREIIYIPKTKEILTPILSIIAIQLLAFFISAKKGIDTDKSRHLSKFVVDKK